MQAIARVNRVFNDTRGGQVVDYLGLADQLWQAFAQTVLEQPEVFTGLWAAVSGG
jgi:type I site-specific restriction-modification system R (restriction) subunit